MTNMWIIVVAIAIVYMVYRMLPAKGVKSLDSDELEGLLNEKKNDIQFIDVREAAEFRSGYIAGFKNIPLSQMSKRITEISSDKPVVLMCRSGARSMQAARILRKKGFDGVINVVGGIMRWKGPLQR
jgi:rhodanese-related sulfurtransferase